MNRLEIPKIHEITKTVLAVTNLYHAGGLGVNAGIIFTEKAVTFIDTGMTIASAAFLWETAHKRIESQNDLYVILTHHHSDHVFGMRVFKEKGAAMYAHRNVQEFLENDNGKYKRFILKKYFKDFKKGDKILGDVNLSLPDHLIKDDTVLVDKIQLLYTPGHVPSELSVYYPDSYFILHSGDLKNGAPGFSI